MTNKAAHEGSTTSANANANGSASAIDLERGEQKQNQEQQHLLNSKKSSETGSDKPQGGNKYGVANAYKWLYGALSRQPAHQGLPATAVALLAIVGECALVSVPAVLLGDIVDAIGLAGLDHDIENAG